MNTIPSPPPLPLGHKKNFRELLRAVHNDDVALLSAIRKSDGQPVALVCILQREEGSDMIQPMPFAVMMDGDPYEQFYDPTV